jgi:hypothetical protein
MGTTFPKVRNIKEMGQMTLLTDEELDFIISYDIKYRMGKELDSGEEDSND